MQANRNRPLLTIAEEHPVFNDNWEPALQHSELTFTTERHGTVTKKFDDLVNWFANCLSTGRSHLGLREDHEFLSLDDASFSYLENGAKGYADLFDQIQSADMDEGERASLYYALNKGLEKHNSLMAWKARDTIESGLSYFMMEEGFGISEGPRTKSAADLEREGDLFNFNQKSAANFTKAFIDRYLGGSSLEESMSAAFAQLPKVTVDRKSISYEDQKVLLRHLLHDKQKVNISWINNATDAANDAELSSEMRKIVHEHLAVMKKWRIC